MNVSCFLKNYETELINKTDKDVYNDVKDQCTRRKCSYDYIVDKFNLNESDISGNSNLKKYFIGCNFKRVIGLYKHVSESIYLFINEYDSLKNEKTVYLFRIIPRNNNGIVNSKFKTIMDEYRSLDSEVNSESELAKISKSTFIPSGSSYLTITSLTKGLKQRETLKVNYYYNNSIIAYSDTINYIKKSVRSTKVLVSTPINKNVSLDYLFLVAMSLCLVVLLNFKYQIFKYLII